jgi:hypothetical protein
MLAVAIAALAVAGGALGLVGAMFVAALSRSDQAAAARESAATAAGVTELAKARAVTAAQAVLAAQADAKRQELRANALEEDLAHAETYPIATGDPHAIDPGDRPGRARLRSALRDVAAVRGASAAPGDQAGPVRDPAAAGATGGSGAAGR